MAAWRARTCRRRGRRPRALPPNPTPPYPATLKRTAAVVPCASAVDSTVRRPDTLWACLKSLDARLVTPAQPADYAAASQSWNLGCTGQQPLGVLYARTKAAVAGAVKCARAAGVHVVPRSGGSNFMCYSERNGTLTLALDEMASVRVGGPRNAPTVTVGGGARLGAVYYGVWKQAGTAWSVVAGTCPSVGVGGVILGAGAGEREQGGQPCWEGRGCSDRVGRDGGAAYLARPEHQTISPPRPPTPGGGNGYLSGLHGLACDQLKSVTLVDARGRLVTADRRRNARLFAAHCGGGGGNFGVVVEMTLGLVPVAPTYTEASILIRAWLLCYFCLWARARAGMRSSQSHPQCRSPVNRNILQRSRCWRRSWSGTKPTCWAPPTLACSCTCG